MDPRDASLLALIAVDVQNGLPPEQVLASATFEDAFLMEVARALTGDLSVSGDALSAAGSIAEWARFSGEPVCAVGGEDGPLTPPPEPEAAPPYSFRPAPSRSTRSRRRKTPALARSRALRS